MIVTVLIVAYHSAGITVQIADGRADEHQRPGYQVEGNEIDRRLHI